MLPRFVKSYLFCIKLLLFISTCASIREPLFQTHSFPSIIPSTKALGAEGSATNIGCRKIKVISHILCTIFLVQDYPYHARKHRTLAPSSMRFLTISPIGVDIIFASPIKFLPLASDLLLRCETLSRFTVGSVWMTQFTKVRFSSMNFLVVVPLLSSTHL